MFFIDYPYVSEFLKKTVREYAIPVVDTPVVNDLDLLPGTTLISEASASKQLSAAQQPSIYANSENAFSWIAEHADFHELNRKVEQFKNKATFRRLIQPLFPAFAFSEIRTEDLRSFPIDTMPLPCIIKPTVGFFSMGVYKVSEPGEWQDVVSSILAEIEQIRHVYPTEVLNLQSFIMEECIDGEEFAVDAYFDAKGEPVVLGIWQHRFSSDEDVGDRVYTTSKALMEACLDEFTAFVGDIGRLAGAENFPIHIELRKTAGGALIPIEVNPLRFGGLCTTGDMAYRAYGLNPYVAYYHQQRPDWDALLKGRDGKLFSIIVLDNSTGHRGDEILSFDYDKVLTLFEKPLELRKLDFTKHPAFGFVFVETPESEASELDAILHSTLREFVTLN